MVGKLQQEIQQTKPFASAEQEVFLNLQRTAEVLLQGLVELLKPAGLSPSQYNVLRILRGAGTEGLACRQVSERMVTRDPDMTRLLDRLEERDLVGRSRQPGDRRVVKTRITTAGQRLLKQLDQPIAALHEQQLGHMKGKRLRSLLDLLEMARAGIA